VLLVDGEVGDATDGHITADEMDEKRKQNTAYEYLCHLEEAKKYVALPPTVWRIGHNRFPW